MTELEPHPPLPADWATFPLQPAGKAPLDGVRWTQESRPRSEWPDRWKGHKQYGIDCGKSDLVVLDEDRSGALVEWLGQEPPATFTVRTGKGQHFYYQADPSSPVRSRNGVAPSVDVKAEGGYVVGPGSVHPNGTEYAVIDRREPVPLPPALLSRLLRSASEPTVELDLTNAPVGRVTLPERIPEGSRNDTLFRYASSLVGRAIGEQEALILLRDAYQRCDPPFTEESPETMWRRVQGEYGPQAAWEKRVQERLDFRSADKEAQRRLAEQEGRLTASEWFGRTGDEYDPSTPKREPCALQFAPGRFALSPGLALVFGRRGSCKSWLTLEAIRQKLDEGLRGLLIDYEMDFDTAVQRLQVLGATAEQLQRFVYVQPRGEISDAARNQLLSRFDGDPPGIVVIDSVGAALGVMNADSNQASPVLGWIAALPGWMKQEWPMTPIVLIDHPPKGSDESAIGSSAKGNQVDAELRVSVDAKISRSHRGTGTVTSTKSRAGWLDDGEVVCTFTFGGGGGFVLAAADPDIISVDLTPVGGDADDMLRIARHVGKHEGVTVEQARTDLGIQPNRFTSLKTQLIQRRVLEQRRGLYKGTEWNEYVSLSPQG